MIIEEFIDDKKFIMRHSDASVLIRKVGTEELYDVAIDIMPCRFDYEETDIPIETEEGASV